MYTYRGEKLRLTGMDYTNRFLLSFSFFEKKYFRQGHHFNKYTIQNFRHIDLDTLLSPIVYTRSLQLTMQLRGGTLNLISLG